MTRTQHTPGPWKWWTSNSWRRLYSERGRGSDSVLMPCVHADGQPDIDVSEADMALIEAAPDLLEALKNTMMVLTQLEALYMTTPYSKAFAMWRSAIEPVIAKVERAVTR